MILFNIELAYAVGMGSLPSQAGGSIISWSDIAFFYLYGTSENLSYGFMLNDFMSMLKSPPMTMGMCQLRSRKMERNVKNSSHSFVRCLQRKKGS